MPDESQKVSFKVAFEGTPDKPIEVMAYAFDRHGALLDSAPVKEGQVQLALPPERLKTARLFIAPAPPPGSEREPTLDDMGRLQAYEPVLKLERNLRSLAVLPVPAGLWRWWYWCSCRVRGRVIKVETVNGVTFERPVCKARVHICEVDRLWLIIQKLPDHIIYRIRDEIVIPRPIPEPDPEPWTIDPGRLGRIAAGRRILGKTQLAAGALSRPGDEVALNPQPLPPKALALQPELPSTLRAALVSSSLPVLRQALLDHVHILKIYLCHWDWLRPWWYRCDELTTVLTDEHGRFDVNIYYPCFGDKPDLYFWVEAWIDGAWTTVYHPSIGCHTYWDFACGSEVTIRVTDPRVRGCGEDPTVVGKKVIVKLIGENISMGEILRHTTAPGISDPDEGLVKGNAEHIAGLFPIEADRPPSPFGGVLEPRVSFGDGLGTIGITHYRWSYRRLGSTGSWDVIEAPVFRRYYENLSDSFKPLQIGPDPDPTISGYYCIIDPQAPGGADIEYSNKDDLASAYFATAGLTPGKYELKLELFKKTPTVMQRANLTAEGVEVREATTPAPWPIGETINTAAAVDDRLYREGGDVFGYRLVVHVDNRRCHGTILDVVVNGNPAGVCGFLEYGNLGDPATISFRAWHPALFDAEPHAFAFADFNVYRVSTLLPEPSASGLVNGAALNSFSYSADPVQQHVTFAKNVSVGTLLASEVPADQTPCDRAAFAETLYVSALATNGYGRLTLDGPTGDEEVGVKAFAITAHV